MDRDLLAGGAGRSLGEVTATAASTAAACIASMTISGAELDDSTKGTSGLPSAASTGSQGGCGSSSSSSSSSGGDGENCCEGSASGSASDSSCEVGVLHRLPDSPFLHFRAQPARPTQPQEGSTWETPHQPPHHGAPLDAHNLSLSGGETFRAPVGGRGAEQEATQLGGHKHHAKQLRPMLLWTGGNGTRDDNGVLRRRGQSESSQEAISEKGPRGGRAALVNLTNTPVKRLYTS